jgi:hypothetical protein
MLTLTDHLIETAPGLDAVFRAGVDAALAGVKPRADYAVEASVRVRHGFVELAPDMLTPPSANVKLDKAVVPSYGLTLFHHRSRLAATETSAALSINACPWAGACVKVCVLNNGNGRYDSTRRGWLWRTDFLARHPESFARVLAWELVRAVRKHGAILFRPNVNSDVSWHRILPSLCDGYVSGVLSYGYSKDPDLLGSDGWLGDAYRVAFSWNEHADASAVSAFLARGGSVAVVSARGKRDATLSLFPFAHVGAVVNADLTDEWVLASGTVGDLSAKGKARALVGKSRFVVDVQAVTLTRRAA